MNLKNIKPRLDKLWILLVKVRAHHRCERCHDSVSNLDSHHLFGKNENVRWDLDNGMCLCRKCHTGDQISAHSTSAEGQRDFETWVKTVRSPEVLETVLHKSFQTIKHTPDDLEEIYNCLKQELVGLNKL